MAPGRNDKVLAYLRSQRDRLQHMRMVTIDAAGLRGDQRIFLQQYLKVLKNRVVDLAAFSTDDGKVLLFVHGLREAVVEAHLEPLRSANRQLPVEVGNLGPRLPQLLGLLQNGRPIEPERREPAVREEASWAEISRAAYVLERADLSQVLFNQAAFALADQGGIPLFTELFVSIAEVEKLVGATASFTANRWAFRDLTLTLDRLVLRRLNSMPEEMPRSGFSLNLNVASVLSEPFSLFVRNLPTRRFGTIMVEFHRSDILEDLARFEVARSLLGEAGIAVAVDGVDFALLPLVGFGGLGVDFIKLIWNERFLQPGDDAIRRSMAALRHQEIPVVLTRCDHANSIAFARRHGIGIVQGRLVERALAREGAADPAARGKPGSAANPFVTLGRPGVPTFGLLVA